MNDHDLNQLVLEKARERVAARHAAVATPMNGQAPTERKAWLGLAGFLGVVLLSVIGALRVLPGSVMEQLHWIVSGMCAQEHTVTLGGILLPLCQRDTGLYAGFLAVVIGLFAAGRGRAAKVPSRGLGITFLVGVLWMSLDGTNSLLKDLGAYHWYEPHPLLRIGSGLAMGISMGTMMVFASNVRMRANAQRDQRIVGGWRDGGLLLGLAFVLFGLTQLNQGWSAYALAIGSVAGMLSGMTIVNGFLLASLTRASRSMVSLRQHAPMGSLAWILTIAECGVLAWLRLSNHG